MPADHLNAGFIDAHVHMNGTRGLETALSAGVSAMRNAGMSVNAEREDGPGCGRPGKPRVVSSCWALYKRGGYGARFGAPVGSRSEIKSEILKLKHAGADIIKVMASGIVSLKKPGTVTAGGFDREELRYIVDEAAAVGLEVMAHANSEPAITAATESGVRSIEHGFFMTARALDVMAGKAVYWTPTIGALVRSAENTDRGEEKREFVSALVRGHQQMLRRAYELGVPLAIGTDCVLPDPHYRAAYQAELSCFEQAGIPHGDVLKIAREGGARLLGI